MNEKEKLFKIEMLIHGDKISSLAEKLGISRQTLAKKIKEGTFTQDEMTKIKNFYNLSDEKFAQLFTKELITNESK